MTALGRCIDPEAALPPDASRLKVVKYSLGAVASLPRRLANPPPRQSKLQLQDVLAGRHCSPIALADFENYLLYTEHSVENLYFTLWLQAYEVEHASNMLSDPSAAARVSGSFVTATRTYIEPNAPYEINLSEQKRNDVLALSPLPPPPPSACEAVHREVRTHLEESMRRWEKHAMSNAGWRRLAFSTYLGLLNACLTITAMIIVRIYAPRSMGRIIAGCLTPWLWFGIVGIVCGLKGVCFLCYSVGGSVRQVSSFELALPRTTPMNVHDPSKLKQTNSFTPFDRREWFESGKQDEPFSPPPARGSEFVVKPMKNMRNRGTAQPKAMIVKLWAPMVEVEDPLVIRAYWGSVVYGFFWSAILAIPIGVIAAAV